MGKACGTVILVKDYRYLCPVLTEKYLICFRAPCALKLKKDHVWVIGWLPHIYTRKTLSQMLFCLFLCSGLCSSSALSEIPNLTFCWPLYCENTQTWSEQRHESFPHKSLYRGLELWGTFWWSYSSASKLH